MAKTAPKKEAAFDYYEWLKSVKVGTEAYLHDQNRDTPKEVKVIGSNKDTIVVQTENGSVYEVSVVKGMVRDHKGNFEPKFLRPSCPETIALKEKEEQKEKLKKDKKDIVNKILFLMTDEGRGSYRCYSENLDKQPIAKLKAMLKVLEPVCNKPYALEDWE